jgi:hypothetical protein
MKTGWRIPGARVSAAAVLVALAGTAGVGAASRPGPEVKNEFILSPGARIVPPARDYRFPAHQVYFYQADWHLLNAGTARLTVQSSPEGEHAVVTADTSGFVNLLFAVHDQFRTTINPHNFCSLSVSKRTQEGSRRREAEVRFDYVRGRSLLQEKDLKTGAVKHVEHPIPGCVTDVMSGFYYVGSLPLAEGGSFVFPVNDGGPTGEITATVEGREQVKTPAGVFPTVRVRAIATAGPLKNKGRMWVWYSEDRPRVPVQVKIKVKWGTLNMRLARVERD